MKPTTFFSTAALALGLWGAAQAQVVGGIKAAPAAVQAGQPVTVTVTIDVVSGNYCGFVVDYGDGKFYDGVSDPKNTGPFTTTHIYEKPGSYRLTAGGRNVQNHPNCGGQERDTSITVTEAPKAAVVAPAVPAMPAKAKPLTAADVCPAGWKVAAQSFNAKTGAYTCTAKAGTALPSAKPTCKGDLTYFENAKKGQFGCKP